MAQACTQCVDHGILVLDDVRLDTGLEIASAAEVLQDSLVVDIVQPFGWVHLDDDLVECHGVCVVRHEQFLLEDVQEAISSLLVPSMLEVWVEVVLVGKLVRDYERQVALGGDASMVLCDLTSNFR